MKKVKGDRELDAWIAEDLFDWDPRNWEGHDLATLDPCLCPEYSSNLDMALHAMEKMYERFGAIGSLEWNPVSKHCRVSFAVPDTSDYKRYYNMTGKDPAMTISRGIYFARTGEPWPHGEGKYE